MATPKEIDRYLCNNRYLHMKLSLSETRVELTPSKCDFIVSLYKGYILEKQTPCKDWDEAIEFFKMYIQEAFSIENKFQ